MMVSEKISFGMLLSQYRETTVYSRTRKCLTQIEFAEKLSKQTGLIITRNKVGYWEKDKTVIQVNDRKMLLAILIVLHEYSGITQIDQADRLLEAGGYKLIDHAEMQKINPGWKRGSVTSSEGLLDDNRSQSSILGTITTQLSNLVSRKSAAGVELYSSDCGNRPINLAQQRLLVSSSFGSYFAGLLERPNIYLDMQSQIDSPSTVQLEGLQPLQRIFWLLGYSKGPRTIVIGGEGGMGKSTLSAKIIRCLYEQQAIDLILGDSAKSRHVHPVTQEIIEYPPGYYDTDSFYNRLCNQLGLPNLSGRRALGAVRDRLIGRRAIIMVDNLETVQKGDELLSSLKSLTSRDIRAIITTRVVTGVKVLGDDLFVVQMQPLTDKTIAERFLLWHIEQYQAQHPALRALRKDIHGNLDWLLARTGGIPLLMQLVLSDVARFTWDYIQTLPSLFGEALLNFLYQARWDDLSTQKTRGNTAKRLLVWIAHEQTQGKIITSKDLSNWAKINKVEKYLQPALALLFERFMIINQDLSNGNFSVYPSMVEFLGDQK